MTLYVPDFLRFIDDTMVIEKTDSMGISLIIARNWIQQNVSSGDCN